MVVKEHVEEIDNLTKYDAFRMNRDQVMDLEIWLKIHTNVSNFETFVWIQNNSVILFKMGKHSDFHLSFFQIVDA